MANTIIPSQLGYNAPGSTNRSEVWIGRDVSVSFEAVGLGKGRRPDALEALKINISKIENAGQSNETVTLVSSLYLDVTDVLEITNQANYPSTNGVKDELFLKLREFAVCEDTDNDGIGDTEKRVVILASQSYPAAS
jgi:hypothetical protein